MRVLDLICCHCGIGFQQEFRGGHKRRYCYDIACKRADQNQRMKDYWQTDSGRRYRRALKARQRADRKSRGLSAVEYDDSRKAAYHKRRAQKKSSARADKVLAAAVFARDDWTCGICSAPVNPDLAYPDPMSVSLDHIVPLSLGGEHTEANTRCSHLVCNVRRGNRIA